MLWLTKPQALDGLDVPLDGAARAQAAGPERAMRQLWADRGTTAALALSIENGDGPVKNWKGVGSRDFPLATKSHKLDGMQVDKLHHQEAVSCGDCPMPCKGIVAVKQRGLSDVRRPDYETLAGFGANLLNDDLGLVTACHDACNRYGMDAVSSSGDAGLGVPRRRSRASSLRPISTASTCAGATARRRSRSRSRWAPARAAARGCGHGVKRAAAHVGKGSERVRRPRPGGQEPAYHDPRFTSLMGVTYIADPTPGRHTAGSASWNETFARGVPAAAGGGRGSRTGRCKWKGTEGKGVAQAPLRNAHQAMNGLGLCMFTGSPGALPWLELVNALTGWA